MKFMLLALLAFDPVFAQTVHHGHSMHAEVKRKDINASDKKVILDILNRNDELFNAFLRKDGNAIEKSASELHAVVLKANSKVFVSLKNESRKLLNIKFKNSNESNLSEYEGFLNPLVEIVKSYNVGEKFNVFHCPMVKKSWIQNVVINKEVKNVFAMEMLECGSQETNF